MQSFVNAIGRCSRRSMPSSLYQDLPVVLDVKSNMSFVVPVGVVVQALARTVQHPRAIPITQVIIDGISPPPFPSCCKFLSVLIGCGSCHHNTSGIDGNL